MDSSGEVVGEAVGPDRLAGTDALKVDAPVAGHT
jgi:hypothetical protein